MPAVPVTIRPATPSDVPELQRLIGRLAEYERLAEAMIATEDQLRAALFGNPSRAESLLAEVDGQAVGFALYYFNFSTFLGRPGLYLEDVFVEAPFRRHGIGRALITAVAKVAAEHRCGRMEWAALRWNTPALEFYRGLGAASLEDWVTFRLDAAGIDRVAHGAGHGAEVDRAPGSS